MNGDRIASQVETALAQAALATGRGTYLSVLRKRVEGTFEYHDVSCLSVNKKSFDTMAMVQRTNRTLLIGPLGAKPEKGDHVGVGFTSAQRDHVTHWARIASVEELSPSGVVLLYRAKLEE